MKVLRKHTNWRFEKKKKIRKIALWSTPMCADDCCVWQDFSCSCWIYLGRKETSRHLQYVSSFILILVRSPEDNFFLDGCLLGCCPFSQQKQPLVEPWKCKISGNVDQKSSFNLRARSGGLVRPCLASCYGIRCWWGTHPALLLNASGALWLCVPESGQSVQRPRLHRMAACDEKKKLSSFSLTYLSTSFS